MVYDPQGTPTLPFNSLTISELAVSLLGLVNLGHRLDAPASAI